MNINATKIRKYIRRIEAMVLAILIAATSVSYSVKAAENHTEQEIVIEQEEESEQQNLLTSDNTKIDDIESEEKEEALEKIEEETKAEEDSQNKDEEEVSEQENEEEEEALEESELEEVSEKENETEAPSIKYSLQTDVEDFNIKLEAFEGVFPEGEELSLFATRITDQDMLDEIDSQLSDVCEGEFKQVSFDIKVLNAAGDELQPDRSKYIDNEDIVPIQLSIEFANDDIEVSEEMEVFHFADDLSSMECLVSTVEGDEITVEPEHFSVFSVLISEDGSYYAGLPTPTGYRTYLEWMPNSTAGLRRLQKIYVYAKAGEKISFGSSSFTNLKKADVTTSLKDSFGYSVGSALSDASIAVTLPYFDPSIKPHAMQEDTSGYTIYGPTDTATVISNIEGSSYGNNNIYLFQKDNVTISNDSQAHVKGTIYNWQQEYLGAKNSDNPGGYEPLSFTAPLDGVYTFRFFGTEYKGVAATKVLKSANFLQNPSSYVGAWDISVTNPSSSEPNKAITGRTFTDALIWTVGANMASESVLKESVYALTSDGFEYKIDFNGIDPFGFVFFTNKRGLLVSSDDHEEGHYRSLARSVRSKRNQLDDLIDMGVHINSKPTTEKDESYFITFEKADSALLKHYTNNENLSGDSSVGTDTTKYTDFNFTGLNSGVIGEGTEGYGGYFSFKYDKTHDVSGRINPSTYEIVLNFTGDPNLEAEYGYAHNLPNEVILSNTLVDGINRIFWDGKDEYGNIVIGRGTTGTDYNVLSFNVKAGEVHFPLLDVENNRNGIKVEMQNDLSDVTDKSKIYYDNSDSDLYGKNIGDKQEALSGVSSSAGAMNFINNSGDQCAIDIWTDYRVATPVYDYTFKLRDLSNDDAFFEAKTEWEYFYATMDGKKHFDAGTLPNTTEVKLQYRIVDKDTVGIGGIDVTDPKWKTTDTGAGEAWQDYKGSVTVSLQKDETNANVQNISLDPDVTKVFTNTSPGSDTYKSVKITSYHNEDNTDPDTKGTYHYDGSYGLCVFSKLPLHPDNSGTPDLSKFYQYRVVDISNTSPDFAYEVNDVFDREAAVDIPDGPGHVTKDIYLEETYRYRFHGKISFNLEFDQLWNDSALYGIDPLWVDDHRPKAVRVAVLYGIPQYEDTETTPEEDITTEKGYGGEDIEVVWRKIQQIEYLTLYADGTVCKDSDNHLRNLGQSELGSHADKAYAGYYPVWKYMSNGDPYFYKIRPVSYSMDGINFTTIEYKDTYGMVPKLSLPEFYGDDDDEDDDTNKQYHIVFYDEDTAGTDPLYPKAVKFTDVPEKAELEITKTDTSNNPIIGKSASYEIKNNLGKNLMFKLSSEGNYTYQGLEGVVTDPDATSIIKTSTTDSIVHADGLPLHDYSISEVVAPDGYQLDASSIDVAMSDFLAGTMVGGFKVYSAKKSQQDKKTSPPSSGSSDSSATSDDIFGTLAKKVLNKNKDITNGKLPKTGGLTGSLAALFVALLMIGYGIYLIKPSKKRKNNGN